MLQTIATRPVGVAELSPPRTCVLGYLAYLELVLAVLLAELGQVGLPAARVARQVRAGECAHAAGAPHAPDLVDLPHELGARHRAGCTQQCLQPDGRTALGAQHAPPWPRDRWRGAQGAERANWSAALS